MRTHDISMNDKSFFWIGMKCPLCVSPSLSHVGGLQRFGSDAMMRRFHGNVCVQTRIRTKILGALFSLPIITIIK